MVGRFSFMVTTDELEGKIWYRFLKLNFVLLYIFSVAMVSAFSYDKLRREYFIACDNGAIHPAPPDKKLTTREDIKARQRCAGIEGDLIENKKTGELALWDGKSVWRLEAPKAPVADIFREIKPTGEAPMGTTRKPLPNKRPLEKNYKLETRMTYKEVGKTLLYGLLAIMIVGEILRRSFFYVVVGRSFFHTFSGEKAAFRWLRRKRR